MVAVTRVGLLLAALVVTWTGLAAAQDKPKPKPQPATSSTKPVPRDAGWMKRHETFVGIAMKGGVDVLFVGDSITDAWGGEGHSPKGGGAKIFAKEFAPLKTANFGISGDQTQHVLWRLRNGELDGIQPKVLMLMIGTNNVGHHSAEEIAAGITAIVKEVHARSPKTKVLLLGVFPRGEKPNKIRELLKEVNSTVAKLDDGGKTVRYLDIGPQFMDAQETVSTDIMPDGVHLTEKGYRIWADAVKGPILELLGK